jgi:hypothetical protein
MKRYVPLWVCVAYLGSLVAYYFPYFAWGGLGLFRPGDMPDGKIDKLYAKAIIQQALDHFHELYLLVAVGFCALAYVAYALSRRNKAA